MIRRFLLAAAMLWCAGSVWAQGAPDGAFWVQVQASPNNTQAINVATRLDQRFGNVVGFEIRGGWYALALGPYDQDTANAERVSLLSAGLIPADSFVATGASYLSQFWPPNSNLPEQNATFTAPTPRNQQLSIPTLSTPTTPTLAAPVAPQGETVSQARASESELTLNAKKDLQSALAWAGYYSAAIDGLYGRGTRTAMRAWQSANDAEPTGIMTTAQRAALLQDYNAVFDGLGLTRVTLPDAGIEIEVPINVVAAAERDAPFVRYMAKDDSGISVILISQMGDQFRMAALYEVMQTLSILPQDGPRNINRRGFTIEGTDERQHSEAFVRLEGGTIKGAVLVWPKGDDARRLRVRARIFDSFTALPGALPDAYFLDEGATPPDAVAGLDIRQPRLTRTGTLLDDQGHILTASAGLDTCSRLDTADGTTVTLQGTADGIAVYQTDARTAPISQPVFQTGPLRSPQKIVIGGYSYGGLLGSPTITAGLLEDGKDLDGNATIARLTANALDGDIGGPVLDRGGAILGVLLPKPEGRGRTLPQDTQFAQQWQTVSALFTQSGIRPETTDLSVDMHPADITAIVEDFAVTLRCWD